MNKAGVKSAVSPSEQYMSQAAELKFTSGLPAARSNTGISAVAKKHLSSFEKSLIVAIICGFWKPIFWVTLLLKNG